MIHTICPLDSTDSGLERVATANQFSLDARVGCEDQETVDRILDPLRQENVRP